MPTHYTNELKIDLPAELKDKTHHFFSLTDDSPSAFNLVISRYPVDEDETLASYADRMLKELERSLPQFELLARREVAVAEQPSLQLDYRWVNQGKSLRQVQTSLFYAAAIGQRRVPQLCATLSPSARFEKWESRLNTMLASVRLRPLITQANADSASLISQ